MDQFLGGFGFLGGLDFFGGVDFLGGMAIIVLAIKMLDAKKDEKLIPVK